MAQISLASDTTTLILNGHVFTDLVEGDYLTLSFPNDLTSRANSANGGLTVAGRVDGDVGDLVFSVQKLSGDDTVMNEWRRSNGYPVILDGSAKTRFTRDGAELTETYELSGGTITAQPEDNRNNQDQNNAMEYTIQFRSVRRSL